MGFYSNYVVPRFVTCACGSKPIVRQRQKVVPRARGKILEIGLGAGHNIPHYDHERVDRVIGIDPCETSWQLAQERVNAVPFDVEFLAGSAEDIPLDDDSVDSVLLTFALCTIPRSSRRIVRGNARYASRWRAGVLRACTGARRVRAALAGQNKSAVEAIGGRL